MTDHKETKETDDTALPVDASIIPVLEELIPVLNERVEISKNYSVSLDVENSTETVEQQLARTHHEEEPAPPELIHVQNEEMSPEAIEISEQDYQERGTQPIDQQSCELVVEKAWTRLETLLMEHLPAQMSGAFLELLSTRIDENKQQLVDDLSLLSEDEFLELLETLETQETGQDF